MVRGYFSTLPAKCGNSNRLSSVIYENADTQKVSILKDNFCELKGLFPRTIPGVRPPPLVKYTGIPDPID